MCFCKAEFFHGDLCTIHQKIHYKNLFLPIHICAKLPTDFLSIHQIHQGDTMKKFVRKHLLIACIAAIGLIGHGAESWTFVSAPDWHVGEQELSPPVSDELIGLQLTTITDMKSYSPELLLIAGDLASGPWVGEEWIQRFAPGGTQEQAMYEVCRIAYGNLKNRFEENGLTNILVAVGDHEIGEDSEWVPGSEVSRLLPIYRDAFQKIWNRNTDGTFKYPFSVGSAPSRPIGTPWEDTSFAYRHKNVLFITIDVFHQPDPNAPADYKQRTTYAFMPDSHLQWLESVLKEVKKDSSIQHIIVQAHAPVLPPVRGQKSSMMYADRFEKSGFWKLMQKYDVDLYIAGEVHAPSAHRIRGKMPLQVVHGAPFGRNYLVVEVQEEKLNLELREIRSGTFTRIGQISLDKSARRPAIKSDGMLTFIDSDKPLLHYAFEEKQIRADNPARGQGFIKAALGTFSQPEVLNTAQMADYYNLKTECDLVPGVSGHALLLDGKDLAICQGSGIITEDNSFSCTAWIKTIQKDPACVIGNGHKLRNLDIAVREGRLAVAVSNSVLRSADSERVLNDGCWHQIAVVSPEKGSRLSELRLYVDGEKIKTRLDGGSDPKIMINPASVIKIGTSGNPDQTELTDFRGAIDEVAFWFKPLGSRYIKRDFKRIHAGNM
jgi:hypothetical protein